MPTLDRQKNNLNLGSGEVHFARRLDDGTLDGYRYLQDTESLTTTTETETLEKMTSDDGTRQKEEDVKISEEQTATLMGHDSRIENLGLYFSGAPDEVTQDADAISDEELTISGVGRSYRLGVDISPRGVRNISNVAVTENEEVDPVVYVEGEDYEVDARYGMIYVAEDGAIEEGETLLVSYDYDDVTFKRLDVGMRDEIEGAMIFKPNNAKGEDYSYEFPNVRIRPGAEVDLQSLNQTEWQSIELEIEILADDDGVRVYIEGEPEVVEVT